MLFSCSRLADPPASGRDTTSGATQRTRSSIDTGAIRMNRRRSSGCRLRSFPVTRGDRQVTRYPTKRYAWPCVDRVGWFRPWRQALRDDERLPTRRPDRLGCPSTFGLRGGREELLCECHAEGGDLSGINGELESPLRHGHSLTHPSTEQGAHDVLGLDGDLG